MNTVWMSSQSPDGGITQFKLFDTEEKAKKYTEEMNTLPKNESDLFKFGYEEVEIE